MSPPPDKVALTLYVAGMGPRSARAILEARRLLDRWLDDRYALRVVDVHQQPDLVGATIPGAPALVREGPGRPSTYVGDLADDEEVVRAFRLREEAEP